MAQAKNDKLTVFKEAALRILEDMVEAPFRGVGMIYRNAKRNQDKPIVAAFKAVGGQLVAVVAGVTALNLGVESLANAVGSSPETLPSFIKTGAAIVGGVLGGNMAPLFMAPSNRHGFRSLWQHNHEKFSSEEQALQVTGYKLQDFAAWPRFREWSRKRQPEHPWHNKPWSP